jgi:hypothetical protein
MALLIALISAAVSDEVTHPSYGLEAVLITSYRYVLERCSLCDELHRIGMFIIPEGHPYKTCGNPGTSVSLQRAPIACRVRVISQVCDIALEIGKYPEAAAQVEVELLSARDTMTNLGRSIIECTRDFNSPSLPLRHCASAGDVRRAIAILLTVRIVCDVEHLAFGVWREGVGVVSQAWSPGASKVFPSSPGRIHHTPESPCPTQFLLYWASARL